MQESLLLRFANDFTRDCPSAPKQDPGEIIESDTGQKRQACRFGSMTQFPRVCGAFARFLNLSGTQTFAGNSQFHLSSTVNTKKRRKFTTTPPTWSGLIRFPARRADNLHRVFREQDNTLIFKIKNDIAEPFIQFTQPLHVVHLHRFSALFEQFADFACVIVAHLFLKQSFGALP
jgi:hypothetical protein